MASPYVYERQSEYWTSRQIEEFFLDSGFEVLTFPLVQYHERRIPADFIFFDKRRCKIFGLQYKALYRNARDNWRLDKRQHHDLSRFPWIYYCLSELKTSRDHRAALHLTRIIEADFEYRHQIYSGESYETLKYSRWGAFYQGLEKCTRGKLVESLQDLDSLLMPGESPEVLFLLNDLLVDVFVADFEARHALHLSPQLRQVPAQIE
jgi:hypothetical protein